MQDKRSKQNKFHWKLINDKEREDMWVLKDSFTWYMFKKSQAEPFVSINTLLKHVKKLIKEGFILDWRLFAGKTLYLLTGKNQ